MKVAELDCSDCLIRKEGFCDFGPPCFYDPPCSFYDPEMEVDEVVADLSQKFWEAEEAEDRRIRAQKAKEKKKQEAQEKRREARQATHQERVQIRKLKKQIAGLKCAIHLRESFRELNQVLALGNLQIADIPPDEWETTMRTKIEEHQAEIRRIDLIRTQKLKDLRKQRAEVKRRSQANDKRN